MWGPKNLPADISGKLQADVAKVLALPDVKQRLNTLGFDPIGMGGEQFATYIRDEMAKYQKSSRTPRSGSIEREQAAPCG